MDTIHTAIQEKRRSAFQYIECAAEKEKVLKHNGYRYEFSPYAQIWSRDYYYAVGWSEKYGKLAAIEPLVVIRRISRADAGHSLAGRRTTALPSI